MNKLIQRAIGRIRDAVDRYKPVAIVGLFSGGHDSATANLIAHEAGADMSLHINTGIGVEQTREYVRETCANRGWDLREYRAIDVPPTKAGRFPSNYDWFVRHFGFPGAAMHNVMYRALKERPLRMFERDIGATSKRPVLYISGARSEESVRRMGTTDVVPQKYGRQVWINPIHDFTKHDCANCMVHCALKRNEVVDLIHKSGECLCGAYAEPGELAELKTWFPAVAKRITDLEEEVADFFPWGWEDNPPDWYQEKKQGQTFMFDYDKLIQSQPLCRKCNIRAKLRTA